MKKRYRLHGRAARFKNRGLFGFRIRFGKDLGGGRTQICALRRCPLIRIPHRGVFQIENEVGQFFLERMTVPNKTTRAGVRAESGLMFEDVTSTIATFDLDFEVLLAAKGA